MFRIAVLSLLVVSHISVAQEQCPAYLANKNDDNTHRWGIHFGQMSPTVRMYVESLSSEELAKQVYHFLNKELDRPSKAMLGPPPHTETLIRQLTNYDLLQREGLPDRQRVNFGFVVVSEQGQVIGYREMSIYRNARPTEYEKRYLNLVYPFRYAQGKHISVHPRYRRVGVGDALLRHSFRQARKIGPALDTFVVDVMANNESIQYFLSANGFIEISYWVTPAGTHMKRFSRAIDVR